MLGKPPCSQLEARYPERHRTFHRLDAQPHGVRHEPGGGRIIGEVAEWLKALPC